MALNLCLLRNQKVGASHPWMGEGCPSCRSAILALVDGSNSQPTPSSSQVRSSGDGDGEQSVEQVEHLTRPAGDFYGSFDARVWAKAWLEIIAEHPEVPTNEDTMIGWFANALMRGYDEHSWRNPAAPTGQGVGEAVRYAFDSICNTLDAYCGGVAHKSAIDEWLTTIHAALATPPAAPQEDTRDGGECIWTRDEFGDPDFYETSCGQEFTFNEGTASDNGVKFCHHCGKPMREVKGNTDEDDSEEDEAVIIDAALLSNPSGEQHDAT